MIYTYPCGRAPRVGDIIDIYGGKSRGLVVALDYRTEWPMVLNGHTETKRLWPFFWIKIATPQLWAYDPSNCSLLARAGEQLPVWESDDV